MTPRAISAPVTGASTSPHIPCPAAATSTLLDRLPFISSAFPAAHQGAADALVIYTEYVYAEKHREVSIFGDDFSQRAEHFVTMGDNPERIATEAQFAALVGVAP